MTDIDRILALRVDLTDADACAQISPVQAAAYLAGKGWACDGGATKFDWWHLGEAGANVPRRTDWPDYGRVMVRVVREVAAAEGRSPLAVWLEMTAWGAEKT